MAQALDLHRTVSCGRKHDDTTSTICTPATNYAVVPSLAYIRLNSFVQTARRGYQVQSCKIVREPALLKLRAGMAQRPLTSHMENATPQKSTPKVTHTHARARALREIPLALSSVCHVGGRLCGRQGTTMLANDIKPY
jgi:hypothetical protein